MHALARNVVNLNYAFTFAVAQEFSLDELWRLDYLSRSVIGIILELAAARDFARVK